MINRHLTHYLSLVGIFGFASLAFFVFPYDQAFEVAVAAGASVSYVAWGVVHHGIHKDLTLMVIWEYVTIAILGLVIVLSLILRA